MLIFVFRCDILTFTPATARTKQGPNPSGIAVPVAVKSPFQSPGDIATSGMVEGIHKHSVPSATATASQSQVATPAELVTSAYALDTLSLGFVAFKAACQGNTFTYTLPDGTTFAINGIPFRYGEDTQLKFRKSDIDAAAAAYAELMGRYVRPDAVYTLLDMPSISVRQKISDNTLTYFPIEGEPISIKVIKDGTSKNSPLFFDAIGVKALEAKLADERAKFIRTSEMVAKLKENGVDMHESELYNLLKRNANGAGITVLSSGDLKIQVTLSKTPKCGITRAPQCYMTQANFTTFLNFMKVREGKCSKEGGYVKAATLERALGLCPGTLKARIHAGQLPAVKVDGNCNYLSREAAQAVRDEFIAKKPTKQHVPLIDKLDEIDFSKPYSSSIIGANERLHLEYMDEEGIWQSIPILKDARKRYWVLASDFENVRAGHLAFNSRSKYCTLEDASPLLGVAHLTLQGKSNSGMLELDFPDWSNGARAIRKVTVPLIKYMRYWWIPRSALHDYALSMAPQSSTYVLADVSRHIESNRIPLSRIYGVTVRFKLDLVWDKDERELLGFFHSLYRHSHGYAIQTIQDSFSAPLGRFSDVYLAKLWLAREFYVKQIRDPEHEDTLAELFRLDHIQLALSRTPPKKSKFFANGSPFMNTAQMRELAKFLAENPELSPFRDFDYPNGK